MIKKIIPFLIIFITFASFAEQQLSTVHKNYSIPDIQITPQSWDPAIEKI